MDEQLPMSLWGQAEAMQTVVGGQRVDTVTHCEPAAFWEEAAMTDCRLRDKQILGD